MHISRPVHAATVLNPPNMGLDDVLVKVVEYLRRGSTSMKEQREPTRLDRQ